MATLPTDHVSMWHHVLAAEALPVTFTAAGAVLGVRMLTSHASAVMLAQAVSGCYRSEDSFGDLSLPALPAMGRRLRRDSDVADSRRTVRQFWLAQKKVLSPIATRARGTQQRTKKPEPKPS